MYTLLTGSAYLLANEARVFEEKAKPAKVQGFATSPQSCVKTSFEEWAPMVYSPGQLSRIQAHLNLGDMT